MVGLAIITFTQCGKKDPDQPSSNTGKSGFTTDVIIVGGSSSNTIDVSADIDIASNIQATSATIEGNFTNVTATDPIIEHGHVWSSSNQFPSISDSRSKLGARSTIGKFTSQLTSLKLGTKYYVRSYVSTQSGKTAYNPKIIEFTTLFEGTDAFVDSRDSKTYKTVVVGNKKWMAENLRYNSGNSRCYQDNSQDCTTYGYLYHWEDAKTKCPTGWRLPTDAEWKELEISLGMTSTNADKSGDNRADNFIVSKALQSGSSKLEILFGGIYQYEFDAFGNPYAIFTVKGTAGYFWTSTAASPLPNTQGSDRAIARTFLKNDIQRYSYEKRCLMSIRCIKDL